MSGAPLIDGHAHLEAENGYVDALLRACDLLGIERVCVSGLGTAFAMADNAAVAAAVRQHPDRLIGFRYLRLGRHPLQDVDLAVAEGFRGLKFTIPLHPYDHESYWPSTNAPVLRAPCLFHTGIVTTKQY